MSFYTRLEEVLNLKSRKTEDRKELIRLIKTQGLPYKDLLLEVGLELFLSNQLDSDEASSPGDSSRVPNHGRDAGGGSPNPQLEGLPRFVRDVVKGVRK